jgi:uncharacterized membrane protein
MPIRRRSTLFVGILFIFVGIIWSLQGNGMIGGSSLMDRNPTFIYIGSFVTLVGFLLLVASYRPPSVAQQSAPV